jgi:hypothetical protein
MVFIFHFSSVVSYLSLMSDLPGFPTGSTVAQWQMANDKWKIETTGCAVGAIERDFLAIH